MQASKDKLLVAITGNIGSGKSSFAACLRGMGHPVHSADEIAKNQYRNPEVISQIEKRWGRKVMSGGELYLKALASLVFASPDDLAFLNSLIHPLVLQEMEHLARESTLDLIFFEVPLLFEANICHYFDYIVLVKASLDVRLQRLEARDGGDLKETLLRMKAQIDDSEKLDKVDFVVDNDGDLANLVDQAQRVMEALHKVKLMTGSLDE